jgi:hypothetical protein
MGEELKGLLKAGFGLVARWSLKFVGGFLTINGVSEAAYTEVIVGALLGLVGVILSLVMRKKDLAAEPK